MKRSDIPKSAVIRFFDKVERQRQANGCHIWRGARLKRGYGHMNVNGKYLLAHRIAFVLANGELDDRVKVLHSCDNPPCVNDEHLFAGTLRDNSRDCVAKGRHKTPFSGAQPGERHHNARLTMQQVETIRRRAKSGERQCSLANEFGISCQQVSKIVKGTRWQKASVTK